MIKEKYNSTPLTYQKPKLRAVIGGKPRQRKSADPNRSNNSLGEPQEYIRVDADKEWSDFMSLIKK